MTHDPTHSVPGAPPASVAVVAIGRNEGDRMLRCLKAALRQLPDPAMVIYVDSGSTDGSVMRARELGVTAVELGVDLPFTAARARNFGLRVARERQPNLEFVQFLDADCEMMPGWIIAALSRLRADEGLAGVAGTLRERYPEATPYNKLCDMEWQAPAGETRYVGGNAMYRTQALEEVGGFDPGLIAGEEPEMCLRLRERGWRLWRLAVPMALHDAAMTRFGQWWRRSVRFGHAQIEVSQKHRHSPKRIWARESRSTLAWTIGPPALSVLAATVLALTAGGWWWLLGLLPLELYDVLAFKVYLARRRGGESVGDAALYAAAVTFAKFAQFWGMLTFWLRQARGQAPRLIEYKPPPAVAREAPP